MPSHVPLDGIAERIDQQIDSWSLRVTRRDGDEPVSSPETPPERPRLTAEQKGKGRKPLTPATPLPAENVDDSERESERENHDFSETDDELGDQIEREWIEAAGPSRQSHTFTPPPPTVVDESDGLPLTTGDKDDGTKAKKVTVDPKESVAVKTICNDCSTAPPGTFCDHLTSSPETDEAMPLPAAVGDKTYVEEGPNPLPQLVASADRPITQPPPARQTSWDSVLENHSRSLSGDLPDEYFRMDPKVKRHDKKKRTRKPNVGDWALWFGAAVLVLGLAVPLVVCSKKLLFTVTIDDPSFKSDPGNWSLLTSYELKFMHYCLNYRSSNGMQTLDSTPVTTECHGMSQYVFNTTQSIDLRPDDVNRGMAQIADNLAQAQHQLAWSTWALYTYLVAAMISIGYANWQSLYEGEPEVFWLTFNSLLLLIVPPTPVALCVYALNKIQKTLDAFVINWNAQSGPTKLALTQTGTVGLEILYWTTFLLSLVLLTAIWVKYKCSPAQRLARQKRHQTLFDEKQESEARIVRLGSGVPDVEAQTDAVSIPLPSRSVPSQPLRSNAP